MSISADEKINKARYTARTVDEAKIPKPKKKAKVKIKEKTNHDKNMDFVNRLKNL